MKTSVIIVTLTLGSDTALGNEHSKHYHHRTNEELFGTEKVRLLHSKYNYNGNGLKPSYRISG